MKTSVYIPVEITYLKNLEPIISIYNSGSVVPDEIVLNVFSLDDEESLTYLRELQDKGYGNLKIYARKTYGSLAENMNYAERLTDGDIVLFHDCRKYPSEKRIEVVQKHFDNNDTYILNHTSFTFDVAVGVNLDKVKIVSSPEMCKRYFPFNELGDVWRHGRYYGEAFNIRGVDMNSVCVRREVLENTKWKESFELEYYKGSDPLYGSLYDFCFETLYKYKKSDIINIPLTIVK